MKKFVLLLCIVAVLAVTIFASCDLFSPAEPDVDEEDETTTADPAETTAPEETTTTKPNEDHLLGVWTAEVPATCLTEGVKGHYTCSVCSKYFAADKKTEIVDLKINALGHSYTAVSAVAATCQTTGTKAHLTCSRCSLKFESTGSTTMKIITDESTLVIPMTDHNFGSKIDKVASDCVTQGVDEHYECSVCKKVFDKNKNETTLEKLKLALANHNYGSLVKEKAATCKEAGVKAHYECSVCHKLFDNTSAKKEVTAEQLAIAVTNTHTYGSLIAEIPATCVTVGVKEHYHCSVCGKDFDKNRAELSDMRIEALGHNWDSGKITTPATCGKGVKTYICTRCGDKKTEEIAAVTTSHTYVTNAGKPATCKATGTKAHYECSVCGGKFVDDGTSKKAVTDDDLIIPVSNEHVYGSLIAKKESTCKDKGVDAHYECSVCGKLFVDKDGKKKEVTADILALALSTNHDYGTEIAEDASTCTKTGVKAHYKCSVCEALFTKENETYTKVTEASLTIDKKDHTMFSDTITDEVPATCTTDGKKAHYLCTVCGKYFAADKKTEIEDLKIAKLGHDWNDGEKTKDPEGDTPGEMKFTCQREGCGETKTEPIYSYAAKFTLSNTTGAPGEEVTLTLSVKCNYEVDGLLAYELQYDENVLEFVDFVNYSGLVTSSTAGDNSISKTTKIINLGYGSSIKAIGTICGLKFKIKSTASAGDVTVTMSADASKDRVSIGTILTPEGKITITAAAS